VKLHIFMVSVLLASVSFLNVEALQAEEPTERIEQSNSVLKENMAMPDKGIPQDLLRKAHCIAIVPSLKKGAFIVGAQYGKGIITCRNEEGTGWTGPSTIRIEGGSYGFQIGGSEVDVVLLVMDESGAEKLMRSKFTMGADATVAAGPVGRSAQAKTDALLDAEILAYSRSHGVFAGVAVEGATLRPDDSDNRKLYGREVKHAEILQGKVKAPLSAQGLINTLNRYSSSERSAVQENQLETR
jgi:lipid-binding SYLF domain-containing protein